MKKVFSLIFLVFISLLFLSCLSSPKASLEPTERFYWTISGTDKRGNPSYVHILGTIHMADDRLYPLPDVIMDDLNNSKRIAAEIGSDDMQELQGRMYGLLMESVVRAKGRDISKELTKEELEYVEETIGPQAFAMYRMMEPWMLTETLAMQQWMDSGLSHEKGLDTVLMDMLTSKGLKWEGLDSLDTQLDILTFGTYDQQLFMLKDLLSDLIDSTETNEYINRMYEAYLNGEKGSLTEVVQEEEDAELDELDGEMLKFMLEYNDKIITQRNRAWAEKIKVWLREGGETFIFAGSAHFLGNDSVFVYLKKNGVLPSQE
ncbi:MAG: TraB/GumN family protein [Treponema sp.]|nr:TraB/GumN family protein [Treponema sp.]